MTQRTRVLIALAILIAIVALVVGVELLRRQGGPSATGEPTLAPGSIPIYLNGQLIAGFTPADLQPLAGVSFVDAEDGVEQEGWLLRDVLLLFLDADELSFDARITVSSSTRGKSVTLTWAEVQEVENTVMFDLSNRGTLKLVSRLENLDTRDEWVQDVDRIEVTTP